MALQQPFLHEVSFKVVKLCEAVPKESAMSVPIDRGAE